MRTFALLLLVLSANVLAQSASHIRVKDYDIPEFDTQPDGITVGSDGALWFSQFDGGRAGRITTSGDITEYVIAGQATDITSGPDGNLWISYVCSACPISQLTTAGVLTNFPKGIDTTVNSITTGPDGALWFSGTATIGRITTDGTVTTYPLAQGSVPPGITSGPDGALWFTDQVFSTNDAMIGRIDTTGSITFYPLANNSNPQQIVTGPDGALWFTEANSNQIGRLTTSGTLTEYPVPTPFTGVYGITAGPDGALWFTENMTNKVARLTLSGVFTEYSLPNRTTNGPPSPGRITAGPDGNLWFTEYYANQIGRVPACGLGLSASFSGHILTMNFDLGTDRPAIWKLSVGTGFGFTRPIRKIVPPHPITLHWRHYPNQGEVQVKSSLSDESGHELCAEWVTVDTGSR